MEWNDNQDLKEVMLASLKQLATKDGIFASDRNEIFGGIFGRDSAISIIEILKVVDQGDVISATEKEFLVSLCRRTLMTLIKTQGREFRIENGEEPGKFVHEYRTREYSSLLERFQSWYIYPDGTLRNYDSLDATPLVLIAIFAFWQSTQDTKFLQLAVPSVKKALMWILEFGDPEHDFLLEYRFLKGRLYGGLAVQSWMDSIESLANGKGELPEYPIAPVEVQGYAYQALRQWQTFFSQNVDFLDENLAEEALFFAHRMKERFNQAFIFKSEGLDFAAQALDGQGRQIQTVTVNPLLLLWSTFEQDRNRYTVLDTSLVAQFVKRAFASDMFEEDAGIRTMSMLSPTFNSHQDSYHNGSFWPMVNGLVFDGLVNWGYSQEAGKLKKASLLAIGHFGSPIELYIKKHTGQLVPYHNALGQESCRNQAWSAAAMLHMLTTSV